MLVRFHIKMTYIKIIICT